MFRIHHLQPVLLLQSLKEKRRKKKKKDQVRSAHTCAFGVAHSRPPTPTLFLISSPFLLFFSSPGFVDAVVAESMASPFWYRVDRQESATCGGAALAGARMTCERIGHT